MDVVYPQALIIEPMKINHIPKGKEHMLPSLCESGEYFGQLKKDGYWYQLETTEEGNYLFSRNKSVTSGVLSEKSANVPHIMEAFKHLPAGTIIVGEIYYPGKRSEDVTPIMGSLPEKAIERQQNEYGYLHYYIHDMIYFRGHSLLNTGASVRYKLLQEVYNRYGLKDFTINGEVYVELAERVDDNLEDFINKALADGEEGVVLKKKTAPYTPGKRPAWDTIKIKQTATCDAICMGFGEPTKYYNGKLDVSKNYGGADAESWPYWVLEEHTWPDNEPIISEKKVPIGVPWVVKGPNYHTMPVTKAYYYGWKTSMDVGAYDENGTLVKIGSVSSGLTEELQQAFSEDGSSYVGKIVELSGMQKNNDVHTLRHFFFKRFRDDKNPNECMIENIFS